MSTSPSGRWHHLSGSEVLDLLESNLDRGLEVAEVAKRQARVGPNEITRAQGQGPLTRFLLEFNQPLVIILLIAGVITALLQEWVDSGVIFAVVLMNAVIGFVQESKALKAIDALAKAMTSEATVLRAANKFRISASELVPGDIVWLQSGDKVPADLRLLTCRELRTDESTLTGESLPIEKTAEVVHRDTLLADRRNMVYSSSLITYGTAAGVVVATADETEIGRISQLISSADVLATPLTRKIAHFSGIMLYIILGMAVATFAVGIIRGEPALQMFMAAVALAVGAIPEGLPAAVTIALAIGVGKMAKRNAIIRKLPAVETLGGTTVICSDKTGTLTQNQMTVRTIIAGYEEYILSGVGYAPQGQFTHGGQAIDPQRHASLLECLAAGLHCNDSALVHADEGWRAEGDPTEVALIVSAYKAGLSAAAINQQQPRVDAIPFESQHQYMATLHTAGADKPAVAYLKGSAESILRRCDKLFINGNSTAALDIQWVQQQVDLLAGNGLRVLALARRDLPSGTAAIEHHDVSSGLSFLGLQGMIDPPRPEAIEAIRACQTAGIQVKMITGDHAGTAAAIASQIGLVAVGQGGATDSVLTGRELVQMSDADLLSAVENTAVFARVAPEQKLRLVKALQQRGHVVAMTGDGVNDAPALRQADIGIAMGISGTEVSKEAADMVLTDDNFSSIEAAIEEGRGVFDNLVKFITWTMPTSIAEGLVIMLAIFTGATLPILPVQALWINMTTAVLLGLMLAFEPKEPGIMARPSRNPQTALLSKTLVQRILLVSLLLISGSFGLLEWQISQGKSDATARTVVVNVIVIGELFYLFNCRSLSVSILTIGFFSNSWLLCGVSLMIALQLGFTYIPVMNNTFESAPIGLAEWLLILAVGVVISSVVAVEKWIRRRNSMES